MLQLGTVEGWVVTHDGETLKTGFKNDFEAVEWLHKRHSYSVDHAVEHEGYDIILVKDGKVAYSYRQEARRRKGLGRISMGNAPKRVFDRNMVEIKPGQKVRAQWPYYYINVRTDEGIVKSIDSYGGVTIQTDHPVPHVDGKGFHVSDEPWFYFPVRYNYDKHEYVAADSVGDPFEHGSIPIWIEVLEPSKPGRKAVMGAAKTAKHPMPIWPDFVDAYLEAALWTNQLEKTYGIEDFAQTAVDQAVKDSNDFILSNRKDLDEASSDRSRHGHDFWLTRNRHGTGFWDQGYGVFGEMLTDSAHAYGEVSVYVGDDGKVYFG